MNFFILASKSSSLLSSILCKLGMDPNFQLFLSSSVQGDTCRGYGQWVMQSREGNPSAGALWKGHPGRQLLPSLVWGSGERRKYRSGARTGLCVQVFSIWNPSQCVHSVSNGKHTSIEEGFYTVCLHLEVAVIRYNNEVKKKKREADGRHMLTKVRALSIFKESIVEDLYSGNYVTRDSMTKEIFL